MRTALAAPLRLAFAAALSLGLAACSDDEEEARLAGERIPLSEDGGPREEATPVETRPVPPARAVTDWTQLNSDASHAVAHVEGPRSLSLAWRADAGAASEDTLPPGQPVVVGGRVFVRDGEAAALAFDAASGAKIWESDLTLEGEDEEDGFGGGLAWADGRLYATTGFGEVLALSPDTGEILWRRRFDAPFRVAPAAAGGRVFAVGRNNVAYALTGATGETEWRLDGAATRYGNLAGSPPATLRSVVAIPFGSGELTLARANRGLRLWTINLGAGTFGEGLAAFSDISSAPVIQGTDIFAGNAGGRLVGIDGRAGRRLWTRSFGSLSPVWAAGDSIFVATTGPSIARLDAQSGRTLWSSPLEAWEDPEDREGPISYHGPVLAGGRLLTVSSDGRLLSHDPVTGERISEVEMPEGARSGPVVAGGAVFVLTDGGDLLAYR